MYASSANATGVKIFIIFAGSMNARCFAGIENASADAVDTSVCVRVGGKVPNGGNGTLSPRRRLSAGIADD